MTNPSEEVWPPASETSASGEAEASNRKVARRTEGTAAPSSGAAAPSSGTAAPSRDSGQGDTRRDDTARRGHEASAPHVAVRLTRTGGVAGITRRWQAEPPAGEEPQWVSVIEDCPWDETPSSNERLDGFVWRIVAVVRHDERSMTLPEADAVGPWATLISVVREASD